MAAAKTLLAEIDLGEDGLEEEFMFMIYTFVEELQRVREHLNSVWQQYHAGAVDLIVAALMTNTAIDMVRQAGYSFEANLKRPMKYPAQTLPLGALPALLYRKHQGEDVSNLGTGEVIDCMSTINPKLEYQRL